MSLFIKICLLFSGIYLYNKYKNIENIPESLKTVIVKLFFLYNDFYTRLLYMLNDLCITYPSLGRNRDLIIKYCKYMHSFFGNYILEPEYKNWIIENTYIENEYEYDNIIENYSYSITNNLPFTYVYRYINLYEDIGISLEQCINIFQTYYSYLSEYSEKINTEHSIIMKYNNNFLVYVCNGENKLFKVIKSMFKFLVIEYVCKNKNGKVCKIPININRNMYNEGNELLSSSFVLWYLNHQPDEYYYNRNYKINCMLITGETITIGFDNYIKIEKNGYEIKNYNKNS